MYLTLDDYFDGFNYFFSAGEPNNPDIVDPIAPKTPPSFEDFYTFNDFYDSSYDFIEHRSAMGSCIAASPLTHPANCLDFFIGA